MSSREAILIPTFHSKGDLPPGIVNTAQLSIYFFQNIGLIWDRTEKNVRGLEIDFTKTKVFPEQATLGFPNYNSSPWIMRLAIMAGSLVAPLRGEKQLPLVTYLWRRGASILQAEDPKYYSKALELVKQGIILASQKHPLDPVMAQSFKTKWQEIMDSRDRFLGQAVNDRLEDGETAILIFGMSHNPIKYLDPDIRSRFLDGGLRDWWNRYQPPAG